MAFKPPSPRTVAREFVIGAPGGVPVASSVQTLPPAVFESSLQSGGYFTSVVIFSIPVLAAGATTVVGPQRVPFGGPQWPSTLALSPDETACIAVSVVQLAAIPGLLLIPIAAPLSGGTSWQYTGPLLVPAVGASVSVQAYSPAGIAAKTATFSVTAVLLGAAA